MSIELQRIKFLKWLGNASQIGDVIDFLNSNIVILRYEDRKLLIQVSWVSVPRTIELKPNTYLIYSEATGLRVVEKETFDTFVKVV